MSESVKAFLYNSFWDLHVSVLARLSRELVLKRIVIFLFQIVVTLTIEYSNSWSILAQLEHFFECTNESTGCTDSQFLLGWSLHICQEDSSSSGFSSTWFRHGMLIWYM